MSSQTQASSADTYTATTPSSPFTPQANNQSFTPTPNTTFIPPLTNMSTPLEPFLQPYHLISSAMNNSLPITAQVHISNPNGPLHQVLINTGEAFSVIDATYAEDQLPHLTWITCSANLNKNGIITRCTFSTAIVNIIFTTILEGRIECSVMLIRGNLIGSKISLGNDFLCRWQIDVHPHNSTISLYPHGFDKIIEVDSRIREFDFNLDVNLPFA